MLTYVLNNFVFTTMEMRLSEQLSSLFHFLFSKTLIGRVAITVCVMLLIFHICVLALSLLTFLAALG